MLTPLIAIIDQHVQTVRKTRETRDVQISAAFRETNSDIPPTIDCKGRFHAPCDGYMLPERNMMVIDYNQCYDDRMFGRGEFLPIPLTDDDAFFSGSKDFAHERKVKVQGKEFIDLIISTQLDNLDIKPGKRWEQDNEETCYLYIKSYWKGLLASAIEWLKSTAEAKINESKAIARGKRSEAPEGKQCVSGVITGLPSVYNEDYNTTTFKMWVELDDKSLVYGTMPKNLYVAEIGSRVQFTATFEHDRNDNTISYFKRPSKPSILELK